jgi:hypothetical protein
LVLSALTNCYRLFSYRTRLHQTDHLLPLNQR